MEPGLHPARRGVFTPGVLPRSTQPKAVWTCVLSPSHHLALERTLGRWWQATTQQALREIFQPQPWSPDPRSREGKALFPRFPKKFDVTVKKWKEKREENAQPTSG